MQDFFIIFVLTSSSTPCTPSEDRLNIIRQQSIEQIHYFLAVLYAAATVWLRWCHWWGWLRHLPIPTNREQLCALYFPDTPKHLHPLIFIAERPTVRLSLALHLRLISRFGLDLIGAAYRTVKGAHATLTGLDPWHLNVSQLDQPAVRFHLHLFDLFMHRQSTYWIGHNSVLHLNHQSAYWHAFLHDMNDHEVALLAHVWDPMCVEQWISHGWMESLKNMPSTPFITPNAPSVPVNSVQLHQIRQQGRAQFFFSSVLPGRLMGRLIPQVHQLKKHQHHQALILDTQLMPFKQWIKRPSGARKLQRMNMWSFVWSTSLFVFGSALAMFSSMCIGMTLQSSSSTSATFFHTLIVPVSALTFLSALTCLGVRQHVHHLYHSIVEPMFKTSNPVRHNGTADIDFFPPATVKNDYKNCGFDALVQLESFLGVQSHDSPSVLPLLNVTALELFASFYDPNQPFDLIHLKQLLHQVYLTRLNSSLAINAPLLEPCSFFEQCMQQFLEYHHLQTMVQPSSTAQDSSAPPRKQRRL